MHTSLSLQVPLDGSSSNAMMRLKEPPMPHKWTMRCLKKRADKCDASWVAELSITPVTPPLVNLPSHEVSKYVEAVQIGRFTSSVHVSARHRLPDVMLVHKYGQDVVCDGGERKTDVTNSPDQLGPLGLSGRANQNDLLTSQGPSDGVRTKVVFNI